MPPKNKNNRNRNRGKGGQKGGNNNANNKGNTEEPREKKHVDPNAGYDVNAALEAIEKPSPKAANAGKNNKKGKQQQQQQQKKPEPAAAEAAPAADAGKAQEGDKKPANKRRRNRNRKKQDRPAGMTKSQFEEMQRKGRDEDESPAKRGEVNGASSPPMHPGGGSPILLSPTKGGVKHMTKEDLIDGLDDDEPEEVEESVSADESGSNTDYSDTANERKRDYKKGGYHPVLVGELYNDRYRVVEKLGWGHFSTVWLVFDYEEKSFQAMKVQKSADHYRDAALDEIKLLSEIMDGAREIPEGCEPSHCASMTDYFEHVGPNGVHVCMIFDLLGENLLSLIERYDYRGIPIPIAKSIMRQTLLGLRHLHSIDIIHTDLKPENVLLSCPKHKVIKKIRKYVAPPRHTRPSLLERDVSTMTKSQKRRYYEKLRKAKKEEEDDAEGNGNSQKTPRGGAKPAAAAADEPAAKADADTHLNADHRPSPKKSPSHQHQGIHGTPDEPDSDTDPDWEVERYHNVTLADFGNSCWTHKQFSDEIQTRQYRSPEVITGDGYGTSSDLWSAACMFFELLTGEFLFDPKQTETYSRDEDHLALMIELLGDIPEEMSMGNGKFRAEFFNSRGELRHIKDFKYWSLRDVLHEKYRFSRKKATEVAAFLLPMLSADPHERATADEMLEHFDAFFDVLEDDYAPKCFMQATDEDVEVDVTEDDFSSVNDGDDEGYDTSDEDDAGFPASGRQKPASTCTPDELREWWANHPLLNEEALSAIGLTIADVQLTLAGKPLGSEDKEMAAGELIRQLTSFNEDGQPAVDEDP